MAAPKKEHALTKQNGAKCSVGDGCLWERMGFQIMGRKRPLSRFMFRVAFLIWMASTVFLSPNPSTLLRTVVPSQLMRWSVFGHKLQYRSWGLLVSTQSDFQCPLGFSHVHLWALLTGNLVSPVTYLSQSQTYA